MKNKGFTLIELIVVIAIIAVLAVVLAPQYIQYVEKGRESNDLQIAQNIIDAVSIAVADPASRVEGGHVMEFRWVSNPSESNPGAFYMSSVVPSVTTGVPEPWIKTLSNNIRQIMNLPTTTHYTVPIAQAASANGKSASLIFSVDSTTGEIKIDASSYHVWVNEIGVKVN